MISTFTPSLLEGTHQVEGTFLCPEVHPLREKGEINQRIIGQSPFCLDMGLRKKCV